MMMKVPDRRLGRGAFVCLLLITFLTAIGNTGLISIMPSIGRTLGISDFLIASIFSLSAFIWAVSSPYWADVSDRWGRKPLIQMGMVGFILSMIGCSIAIYAGEYRLLAPMAVFCTFFLCRASYGIFGSAAATATQAYIADHSDNEGRVYALTGLAGALSLGTIFGPAIAPFLIFDPLGLTGPLIGFAVFAALALWLSVPMLPRGRPVAAVTTKGESGDLPPNPEAGHKIRDLLNNPRIAPYLVYGLVLASAQAINIYSIGFVVIDRMDAPLAQSQQMIGLVMCAGALAGLLGQWGLVRWLAMSPKQMIQWGGLLALAGNLVMLSDRNMALLAIGFALASLGYGFGRPGFSAGASLAGSARQQSSIAAAVSSIAGASIVLPPVIAVAIYERWPAAPFLICLTALAGIVAYAFWHPSFRKAQASVS